MAVCEYCRSTLVKDADSVKDIGKMSAVLEDYTPLQLNTSGQWQGQGFALVGRIQLRYESGLWNEWYLLFDDGGDGWLADASGQYMLTRRAPAEQAAALPKFESLRPGSGLDFDKRNWIAGDVRTARCTGGEGELPFTAGQGWVAQVADFRDASSFLTLDYADGYPPAVYVGELLTLGQLKLQLQRSADDISRSADRYQGKAMPLACPACGSPITYRAGIANYVVCNSCHSEVDCTESTAVVLRKQSELAAFKSSLKPGDSGNIGGQPWTVLGLLQCTDDDQDEPSTWIEYLLFNEEQGLLWLIEQDDGWDRVKVLDEWPRMSSATVATWQSGNFRKGFEYRSRVLYAAGTFNWRVHVGDSTLLTEFGEPGLRLTRETSDTEIVWTRSSRITRAQVARWFKDNKALALVVAQPEATSGKSRSDSDLVFCRQAAKWYVIILGILNVPIALAKNDGWLAIIFAILLLWAPLWLLGRWWEKD